MRRTALAILFLFFLSASPVAGFELPQPDHGVEDDFNKLWSAHEYDSPPEDGTALEYLTQSSDYVYSEPPSDPDRWNRGEVAEFDGGGRLSSVHPPGANLSDGTEGIVRDAYVSVFAVSPSTLVHYSPDREVLYVSDSGDVHGFVDYRLDGADSHTVEVEVAETGDSTSETGGFSLSYDGLGRDTLTLRATVEATRNTPSGEITDTVVVRDSVDVQPYNVSSPPTIALTSTYPNGDSAAFVVRGTPWSSVKLPNGATVGSNWRFFSARDTDWDQPTVVERSASTDTGETYHPLQVHAYPSRSGVYIDGDAEVHKTLGDRYEPPELPEGVTVDTPDSVYETVRAVDVRYNGSGRSMEVSGILNSPSAGVRTPPVSRSIQGTNLTLSVAERYEESVAVRVSLRNEDGEPIDTRSEGGYVRLEGRRNVTTELDGAATVNVTPKPSGGIFGRYVPNDWHDSLDERRGQTPYDGDTDTLIIRNRFALFSELSMLTQLGVFLLPLLLMTYMLDKAFGLGVWPPWRRI